MLGVRWAWADAYFPARGWSDTSTATDVLAELRKQRPSHSQNRQVKLAINGSQLTFRDVEEAASFLQPHIECHVLSAGGRVVTASVRQALICTSGHPIHRRTHAAARWFSPGFLCNACGIQRKAPCTEWRCHQNCGYHVCDGCYQHAMQVSKGLGSALTESVQHQEPSICEKLSISLDTSPCASTEEDLNEWEMSWWGEVSTTEGDAASDIERLSDVGLSDIQPHSESSSVAIEVACDLLEQHLNFLSAADDSQKVENFLRRLTSSFGMQNVLEDADIRQTDLMDASLDFSEGSAMPSSDETETGPLSSTVSASGDHEDHDCLSLHHQASAAEKLLIIQLEKVSKDNDCLRDQLKEMESLRSQLAKVQAESEMWQERSREMTQALPDIKGDSTTTRCELADLTCSENLSRAQSSPGMESPPDATPGGKGASKGKGKGKAPNAAPPVIGVGVAPSKGKGKGKCVEPTKPGIDLSCEVKSLPWKRWLIGMELTSGETIWDRVCDEYTEDLSAMVPREIIEQRFAKTAGLQKVERQDEHLSKTPKFSKLASIGQDRLTREVAMKTLPAHLDTPQKAINAICSLDSELLSAEASQALRHCLCPTAEQLQEMQAQREAGEAEYLRKLETWKFEGAIQGKEPWPFQWDSLETYLEGLGALPAVETRLSCWSFLSTLPEQMEHLRTGLQQFEAMVRCFQNSTELPFLLSLILAFGNTLNGGKNQKRLGQADGFPVEVLGRPGGLDVVNDAQGRNLRQLIFETYFSKTPVRAQKLLEELAPLFALVQRSFGKTDEFIPVPIFKKEVRIQFEDFDQSIEQLRGQFAKQHVELQSALQHIEDVDDQFAIQMPVAFERAKHNLEELAAVRNDVRRQFEELLKKFRAETYRGDPVVVDGKLQDGNPKEEMTSSVWCLIWDDLFVKGSLIMEQTEKVQKEVFGPRFCGSEPLNIESLEMLWQLRKPASLEQAAVQRKRRSLKATTV